MSASRVFELRQYALHPGRREVLLDVFDREFVESQEAHGVQVVGQFRDLDNPDRFVWLRGFTDMTSRQQALSGFYGGPVWAEHKDVANATMLDFDDVLLLCPVTPDTTFPNNDVPRRPVGSSVQPESLIAAFVYRLARPVSAELLQMFADRVEPLFIQAGGVPVALLQTEPAPNTYPALPVREGEHVLVRFARFDSADAHATFLRRLADSSVWQTVQRQLRSHLVAPPQQLRLQPTARSLLQ